MERLNGDGSYLGKGRKEGGKLHQEVNRYQKTREEEGRKKKARAQGCRGKRQKDEKEIKAGAEEGREEAHRKRINKMKPE